MLDHIFLSVSDVQRSVDFYTAPLAPLGIAHQHDDDGKGSPPGHPDLKGFGANGRVFLWLRQGAVEGGAVHDPDGYSLEFVYKRWQHEQGTATARISR
jgi:catechol 2,3-dioxygenase-like lactoylglutathione lyase family enzyme